MKKIKDNSIFKHIRKHIEKVDVWLMCYLYKEGLSDFRSPRKIRRFMKRNKIELRYDYILELFVIYKDGEFKSRIDGRLENEVRDEI